FASVGAGVQLTADWVLAAAHLGYAAGGSYTNGFGTRSIAAAYNAPGSQIVPANDLTLLRLVAGPVVSPAPLVAVSSLFVPYGSFAAQAVTITSANGNIYPQRGFAYASIDESLAQAEPDGGGPLVTVNWLLSHSTQTYVEGGDSGGGLFMGQVLNTGLLLGITSAQIQDGDGRPTGSTFVQPAAYRGWLDQTMLNDPTDMQAILWQAPSAVPEPAALALTSVGLLMMAGWVRRQRRQPSRHAGEAPRG
ncbi:MAG: trypsin-like serine protease, partial [Rubrivivax sp.]